MRFPGSRHPTLLDLPSDLVAQGLRWNDGHFFDDPLVRVEIHRQPGVVFLNNDLRGLLDGLCTNATLEENRKKKSISILESNHSISNPFRTAFLRQCSDIPT